MPGVSTLLKSLMVLAPLVAAVPANYARSADAEASMSATVTATATASTAPVVTEVAGSPANADSVASATSGAPSAAATLSDVDILNFALTAEHLESTFYMMGFSKFSNQDFMALNLSMSQINDLKSIGGTEATHVTTLTSAITAAGGTPVEACSYNFDAALSSADAMVKTARVLEAVGVSAYLGAAPLINSSAVLSAAGSILTVEARHQAFIRLASGAAPVPAAFDTPLQPRAVFTLAAQFINSCPEGSNLNIQPFPTIALQNPGQATVGQNLKLGDPSQPAGAGFCAFVAPGGSQYTPLTNGNCQVPSGLEGEVYMMITKSMSTTDSEILAGPAVIQPS